MKYIFALLLLVTLTFSACVPESMPAPGPTPSPTPEVKPSSTPVPTAPPTATPASSPTPVPTWPGPIAGIPQPVYLWLAQQQDSKTGLLASQQDRFASTYNNALAVMVFTLGGDYNKARRILDFFNGRADEFFKDDTCNSFALPCSRTHLCGSNAPCGFFQFRDSTTGIHFHDVNRWMGDNAWLLLAIHHYQTQTGDTSYGAMADAIVRLLKSLQQSDGYIASGWENGDSRFNRNGHTEGNLDAYKALALYGETTAAQKVKDWLDFTDLDWKDGPLDLHSWRVQSLGREYGFCLPDTERMDDKSIRYKSVVDYNGVNVTGFLHKPASQYYAECQMHDNIWVEGTGQMAVSFCKAGYEEQWEFYVGELEKLLFEPDDFPGTRTLPFLALPDPKCHSWVDLSKGHVAAVSWYILARLRFDPFDGEVMDCSIPRQNPVARIEAENYDKARRVLRDNRGLVYEGRALHIGGYNDVSGDESGWALYQFNVLVPITITAIRVRYADDVGGDTIVILLDGNTMASFNTVDTGTWDDYVVTDFSIGPTQIEPGLHTLQIEATDNGTWGVTIDHFQIMTIP